MKPALLFLLVPAICFAQADEDFVHRAYPLKNILNDEGGLTKSLADFRFLTDTRNFELEKIRLTEGEPLFDMKPFFGERGIEFGEAEFAIWNEKSRTLTLRATKANATALERVIGTWDEAEGEKLIGVEAVCIRAHSPPDPKALLDGLPSIRLLLDGDFGEPELVATAAIRTKSGQRAKSEQGELPLAKELTFEIDAVLGPDDYTIDLNFIYHLRRADGGFHQLTTSVTLAPDKPLMIELGGRGTPESPAHFLVLRAWLETASGE